jgi:SWI/SNF-related matrix-associated actin-dependent regulator 1 of chromatin subfamily A
MQKLELPFQTLGTQWLLKAPARYLGDQPGLGKSKQVIDAADIIGCERILVIGPAISRFTWLKQFQQWGKGVRAIEILKGRDDKPSALANVTIVSFDYCIQQKVNKKDAKTHPLNPNLLNQKWDLVVIDEAHFLKTPDTRRTRAILGTGGIIHQTKRVWFLSGTPMPNSLPSEMWPVLFSLGLTKLNFDSYLRDVCNGYDNAYRKFVPTGLKHEKVAEIQQTLSRFFLQRKKLDVLKDLPKVMYGEIYVEGRLDRLPELTEEQKYFLTNFSANDPLTQMKLLEMSAASISTLRRFCGLQKVESVAELIEDELANNAYKKIVIFGIHKAVLLQLEERLRKYGTVLVNGEVPGDERQRRIEKFQTDPTVRIFLGNIAAAGTNITLVAANQVFFIEEDFRPGDNQQAVDRCNRIGQLLPVTVRRAKLENSLDDKLNEILSRKVRDGNVLFGT